MYEGFKEITNAQPVTEDWFGLYRAAYESPTHLFRKTEATTSLQNTFLEFTNPFESTKAKVSNNTEVSNKSEAKPALTKTEAPIKTEVTPKTDKVEQQPDKEAARERTYDVQTQLERAPEAVLTPWSKNALVREANLKGFEPREQRNERGDLISTTFTLRQIGVTERALPPNNSSDMKPFFRVVKITVPADATHLKQCTIEYGEREEVSKRAFLKEVDDMQARQAAVSNSRKVCTYTHGIITSADAADTQALALELASGHPVIVMDWKANRKPLSFENASQYSVEVIQRKNELYNEDIATAAKSSEKLSPWFQDIVKTAGPNDTQIIAFSHGASVNQGALQSKGESVVPEVQSYLELHPDVKSTKLPDSYYSSIGIRSYVLGSRQDQALLAAAGLTEPTRLGRDTTAVRNSIKAAGGIPLTDPPRNDGKTRLHNEHYINFAAVAQLLNNDRNECGAPASVQALQEIIDKTTTTARGPSSRKK